MSKVNKIRTIGIAIALSGVIGLVYMYCDIKRAIKTDQIKKSANINYDYNNLLKLYKIDSLNIIQNQESKTRNPFSLYRKNKDYYLMIHKFTATSDKSLNELIFINKSSEVRTNGIVYHSLSSGIVNLCYKSGVEDKLDKFYLEYNGEIISKIKSNDNVLHLLFLTKNISIRYKKDCTVDMYLDNTSKFKKTIKYPINVVFLKKEQHIYLLIFYPFDVNNLTPVLVPKGI